MPMGPSKPARITGGDTIISLLRQQVERVEDLVTSTAQEQMAAFEIRQRERVGQHDRWSGLSEHLGSWEDDEGNYAFGIPDDSPGAEEAQRLEYGDDDIAPSPMIRMGVLSEARYIGWAMRDRFQREGW